MKKNAVAIVLLLLSSPIVSSANAAGGIRPPNVVIFPVDDMDYSTLNVNGCPVKNLTPNMDRLAREGILFQRAHLNSAVCQPSRQSLMTGLHTHRNGTLGFVPVSKEIPNLSEILMSKGWHTASYNKGRDYESFQWSHFVGGYGTKGFGRKADLFVADASADMDKAKAEGKPFLINVATSDPHRVFAGSTDEANLLAEMKKKYPKADAEGNCFFPPFKKVCSPEEAWVPPYLPDLPEVREEWAQYYNTVYRADETLGRILQLIDEKGETQNTMVIFYSDNGASFPTSKQNCYPYSTLTPLIIRWPGVVKPGSVDARHFVSTMDIMPTLLEIAGIESPKNLDGRSFLPLLRGESQQERDSIYTTQNYITPGVQVYPMRAIHTATYTYIFNAWSNGTEKFSGECHSGLTMKAIEKAAATDEKIRKRMNHLLFREKEELYDIVKDPWCLNNLAQDPEQSEILAGLKKQMERQMISTSDPLLPSFTKGDPIPSSWLVKGEAKKEKTKKIPE